MSEEWRPVVGYEGLYEVSNTGFVRSVKTGNILKDHITSYGYRRIGIYKNGVCNFYFVHRLVAQAFIKNFNNLPMVNHKDEDKTNNRVDNLEWCDAKYNNNYGTFRERARNTNLSKGRWTGLNRKEYFKKYYEKNKEKILDKQRKYYDENRDKVLERQREYYKNKKDDVDGED